MVAKTLEKLKFWKVKGYKRIFLVIAWFIALGGFIASIVSLFINPGLFLNGALLLQGILDICIFIFAYGLAVFKGKRWHIFGLLIFVFFGSFVVGLFSMVGRESTIGYYIWGFGGVTSLSLIIILIVFWEKLIDG